ncbi:hypothetical protein ACFX2C_030466 [Malus domestica]
MNWWRGLRRKVGLVFCTSFSFDYKMREQYRNPWNVIRVGKLLEDFNALVGTIAFKHYCGKDGTTKPLLLVTSSVDKI